MPLYNPPISKQPAIADSTGTTTSVNAQLNLVLAMLRNINILTP